MAFLSFLWAFPLVRLVAIGGMALTIGYAAGWYQTSADWRAWQKAQEQVWQAKLQSAANLQKELVERDAEEDAAFKRKITELSNDLEDKSGDAFTGRDADRVRDLWR